MTTQPTTDLGDEPLVAAFSAAMIRAADVLAEMSGRPIRISASSIERAS